MARIRSIKPEFWKSEAIARHSFFARLVFIGLWTYVDDNGVGLDNHKLITAELFPLEDDFASVSRDTREALAELAEAGRILRYTVEGKSYMAIVNWSEHQKIDRPGKARYPGPGDPRAIHAIHAIPLTSANADPRETLDESSRDTRETPSPGAVEQGTGEQGNREQGTGTREARAPAKAGATKPPTDPEKHPGFMEWWAVYPRRESRADAYKAWLKADQSARKAEPGPIDLLDVTRQFAEHVQAERTERKFIPYPATWLGRDRWRDPIPKRAAPANGHRPFTNPDPAEDPYGGDL